MSVVLGFKNMVVRVGAKLYNELVNGTEDDDDDDHDDDDNNDDDDGDDADDDDDDGDDDDDDDDDDVGVGGGDHGDDEGNSDGELGIGDGISVKKSSIIRHFISLLVFFSSMGKVSFST